MNPYFNLIIFLAIIVFGIGIEVFLSQIYFKENGVRKKHKLVHFKFSRYVFLISVPMFAILFMTNIVGISIIKSFLIFAVFGTVLEYCIGYSYQIIVGQRLWTYHRYSVRGYTSLLSIPLWGLCGVMFYLLVKVISG